VIQYDAMYTNWQIASSARDQKQKINEENSNKKRMNVRNQENKKEQNGEQRV